MITLYSYLPGQVRNVLEEEILQRGKEAIQNLEKMASGALVLGDENALILVAKGITRTDQILYVVILDKDGRVVAEGGNAKTAATAIERIIPRARQSEADWRQPDQWPGTRDDYYHLARPVFYEQLRVGTLLLGVSTRAATAARNQIQKQVLILGSLALLVSSLLALLLARSLQSPLQKLAAELDPASETKIPVTPTRIQEFKKIQDQVSRTRELFQRSLQEMESQQFELMQQTAALQEQNDRLSSRLNSVSRQSESMRLKVQQLGNKSASHAASLPPQVQFALSMTPEVIAAMEQIRESAKNLHKDIQQVIAYVELLEASPNPNDEDLESIRNYREYINFEKIISQVKELMETIQSGAAWSEQLTELLNQLDQDASAHPG
jgi:methyl-accepting chemotaxis protein